MSKLCYVNSRRTSEIKGERPSSFSNSISLFSTDLSINVLGLWMSLFLFFHKVTCMMMYSAKYILIVILLGKKFLYTIFQAWKFTEILIWKYSKIILVNYLKINCPLKSLWKLSFLMSAVYKKLPAIFCSLSTDEMTIYFAHINKQTQELIPL